VSDTSNEKVSETYIRKERKMGEQKFSMKEAIGLGWTTIKNNIGFFVGLLVVAGLCHAIPNIIQELTKETMPILSAVIGLLAWILQSLIALGLIKISLHFCDNESSKISELFSCLPLLVNYLISSILYFLMVFIGIILLIVPGIIVSIRFQFFGYFIVDEEAGPIEALKKSFAMTRGTALWLLLFGLLVGLINLVGALALIIGLFVTVPIGMIAYASVYRKLKGTPQVVIEKENKT